MSVIECHKSHLGTAFIHSSSRARLPPVEASYSNAALGVFATLPPSEMQDVTESAKAVPGARRGFAFQQLPRYAARNVVGPRPGSCELARNDLDDTAAKAKLSAWVMGFSEAPSLP
jgi:hypothetical protein